MKGLKLFSKSNNKNNQSLPSENNSNSNSYQTSYYEPPNNTRVQNKFLNFLNEVRWTFTTKDGLIGDYDYLYLFLPQIPFLSKKPKETPFFSLNQRMPILLAMILGFQHSLAMLAGVMTPAIILSGTSGANLDTETTQYLVSASFIACGILSSIQITRFHIPKSKYYIGTGLISVVGTSFSTIPVATGAFAQMYRNGTCPMDENGNKLPCPDGYGKLIGTTTLCSLLEIALSFIPPKILQKVFPPIVTGPTVMLIGVSLVQSGFEDWAGGSGCVGGTGIFAKCPTIYAPHPLPWGSASFIGLGFSVYVTIIICERWGSPIMKSCAVIVGLLVGCIIAAACGYFSSDGISIAPAATFIWKHTFNLKLYGPVVLPMLAVYIVLMMEAIGDITATRDVSRLSVEGPEYESCVQGGILADGINGCLAGLMTLTPMSTFAQNNGVISLTRCASRRAGYFCCFFLLIMGIFSKFAAALVAIPSAVMGGMTTFLFCAVAVSGMRITATVPFTRRNRFLLTATTCVGFGAILVPNWFTYFFTYDGPNGGLSGLLNAITLIMETGFAVTGFLGVILNLLIPEEDDAPAIEATELDAVQTVEDTTIDDSNNFELPLSSSKKLNDEAMYEKNATQSSREL